MFNRSFQKIYRKIILEEFNPILKQEFKELPHQFLDDQIQTDIGPIQNIISGKYGVVIAKTKDVIKKLKEQNDIFMLNQFKKYYKYGDISENFVYNAALIDIKSNRILAFLDWETLGAIGNHLQDQDNPTQTTALDGLVALAKGLTISSNLIQTFIKVSVEWAMGGGQGEFYDRFKNNEKQLLKKRKSNNKNRFNKLHNYIKTVKDIEVNDRMEARYYHIFSFTGNPIFSDGKVEAYRIGSDNISEIFLTNFYDAIWSDEHIEYSETAKLCGLQQDTFYNKVISFKPENIDLLKEKLGATLKESIVFFISNDGGEFLGFIDFLDGVIFPADCTEYGGVYRKCPQYMKNFLKEKATSIDYYAPKVFSMSYNYAVDQPVGYLSCQYLDLFGKNDKSRFDGFTPSAESKNYLVYDVSLGEAYVLLTPEDHQVRDLLVEHNFSPKSELKLLVKKENYEAIFICSTSGSTSGVYPEDQEALSLLGIEQQEE